MLKLKSTGQLVFIYNSDSTPEGYSRVFRAFQGNEGTKSPNCGELILVRKSNLIDPE